MGIKLGKVSIEPPSSISVQMASYGLKSIESGLYIGIKMGKVPIWPSSSISIKMALYGLKSVGSGPVINWDQISKSVHLAVFEHLGKNGIIWPQKRWGRAVYLLGSKWEKRPSGRLLSSR